MLDVLAGYDPNDQASAKAPKVDYGAAAQRPIKGMRIALARSWYEGKACTPDMAKGMDEAVRVLRDLGAIVEEVVFPDIWDYHICGRVVITVEAHAIHRQEVIETPEKFGYTTRRRFQLGAFLTAEQYLSAAALPAQAAGRHARGHARLRPGDGGQPVGRAGDLRGAAADLPLPRQGLAQHAVQRHRPAGARRCAAASAATASRSPSSSPAGRSTRPASSPPAPPTNAPRRGACADPRSDSSGVIHDQQDPSSRRSVAGWRRRARRPARLALPARRRKRSCATASRWPTSRSRRASPTAAPAPTSSPASRSTIRWSPGSSMSPTGRAS